MNAQEFEAAKATVRRERDIPDGMCQLLTEAQVEELVRIIREEMGLLHREAPSARRLYENENNQRRKTREAQAADQEDEADLKALKAKIKRHPKK